MAICDRQRTGMTKQPAGTSCQFRNLLVFLLIYLFGSPFLETYPSLAIVAHFLLSVALCFSVYAVQKQQNQRSIAMVLLLPILILYWLGIYEVIPFSSLAAYILLAVFFMLLIHSFATQLIKTDGITVNELFVMLCLYLIIGMFWGTLYALLYDLIPGSYAGALLDSDTGIKLNVFNYFSLVTLTTLGYGDITPQTPGAGALCQMEAIMGQFYIAVVVAWLVGNFVSERQKARHQRG